MRCWRGAGLGLGLGFGSGFGVAAGLGGCLAVVLGGGLVLGCGVAEGWGFGRAAGAGFAGLCCHPALPVVGFGAAGALAAAGAPTVQTGSGARMDGVARGLGDGVLDEGVVVGVDEVVVVVEVVQSAAEETHVRDAGGSHPESEAEEIDVGDGGGSRTAGPGTGCWVLWAMRVRTWVWASGVCARLLRRPVCVHVLVPWVVSRVVRGGVVELSWMRGVVSYPRGEVHDSSKTCGCPCRRPSRVPK